MYFDVGDVVRPIEERCRDSVTFLSHNKTYTVLATTDENVSKKDRIRIVDNRADGWWDSEKFMLVSKAPKQRRKLIL